MNPTAVAPRRFPTLAFCLVLMAGPAQAVEHAGVVDTLSGTATLISGNTRTSSSLSVGSAVDQGDTLTTGSNAEVVIRMDDGGVISLRSNSSMRIDEYLADGSENERSFFSLFKGAMRSVTGWIGKAHPRGYRISTATATIGVRGTDHEVILFEQDSGDADEAGIYDIVHEGSTYMHTEQGEVDALPGLPAFLARGGAGIPLQLQRNPAFLQARKILLDRVLENIREQVRDQLPILHEERKKGFLKNIFEDKERRHLQKDPGRQARKAEKLERRKQDGQKQRVDRRDINGDKMKKTHGREKWEARQDGFREWRDRQERPGHGYSQGRGHGKRSED